MSPSDRRRNLWNKNIIIVLLALVIIATAYVLISSSPDDSVLVYSVEEIVENSDKYLNKNITVDGYYYNEGTEGEGVITSLIIEPGSSLINYKQLPVNHSSVNMSLASEIKYRFTGVLTLDESSLGDPVILVAEKIVQV